ncbi:MAG: polyprenyl synthetase family protein [Chlorobiales bacterium]|nr:polyprenyl synthetase family protein [Chlorobiales bacterium]
MSVNFSKSAQAHVQKKYLEFHSLVNSEIEKCLQNPSPETLYAPARYILSGKGKRIRPILVLLGSEAISGSSKKAIHVALAVEVLHNFTLMHDDIMDHAALRHGRETVHKKWNESVAILSGDMMLAFAYELALKTKSPNLHRMLSIITESTITICEGQAYDMEFEQRKDVTISEYLNMISKKTGRLISASLELGAIAADGTPAQVKAIREFGELIGQAFQVQDDLLDIMADDKKFGKVPGGDLVEGKKTFLLLRALELANGKDKKVLQSIIKNDGIEPSRVEEIKAIYEKCGVLADASGLISDNFKKAVKLAQKLPNEKGRQTLIDFASMLMQREF